MNNERNTQAAQAQAVETYSEVFTKVSETFVKRFGLVSDIPPMSYIGTCEENGDKRLHLAVPMNDGEIVKITVTSYEKNKRGDYFYSYADPKEVYEPGAIYGTGHIECPQLIDENTRYGLDLWIPKETIETVLNGIISIISDINYHMTND